jgi:hypothetical protein
MFLVVYFLIRNNDFISSVNDAMWACDILLSEDKIYGVGVGVGLISSLLQILGRLYTNSKVSKPGLILEPLLAFESNDPCNSNPFLLPSTLDWKLDDSSVHWIQA